VNQLKALARKLLGTPKHLKLLEGDTDVFGDGSVTLVSTPGHTPGSQSLLVHLKNSGFIILSGDVVHLEENFEKNTVPSLNTDKAASIASMDEIRRMIAAYQAKLFINHDKAQSDTLKLLPAFYGLHHFAGRYRLEAFPAFPPSADWPWLLRPPLTSRVALPGSTGIAQKHRAA